MQPIQSIQSTLINSTESVESTASVTSISLAWKICLGLAVAVFATTFVYMAFFPEKFHEIVTYTRAKIFASSAAELGDWRVALTSKHWALRTVEVLSILAIPFFLLMFPLLAAARKLPVYEEFVEGAKEGFQVAMRIIPFLVAIFAAMAMFREAGGILLLTRAAAPLLEPLHCPSEILPLVFMRPLSGSGSLAIFAELVTTHGADNLISKMAGTIMGSTETTFYVIAVYFGAVSVRRSRHAVPAGLLADAAGVVASVIICNLVFG